MCWQNAEFLYVKTRGTHTVHGLYEVNRRIHIIPNVSVDSLAFLLHIREVPNLNLDLQTSQPVRMFMVFLNPYVIILR
jgi:hypothetical protein